MGLAVVSLLILVVVAIIAIPILLGVFGSAASRNENRADSEEDRARQEGESGEQDSGRGSGT